MPHRIDMTTGHPWTLDLAPAVMRRARTRFGFLLRIALEDVRQIAALHAAVGLERDWRAADRALYHLARDLGWWRPAAGLARGHSGPWRPFFVEDPARFRAARDPRGGRCVCEECLAAHGTRESYDASRRTGYRRDPERHCAAREKVSPERRVEIARMGGRARRQQEELQ